MGIHRETKYTIIKNNDDNNDLPFLEEIGINFPLFLTIPFQNTGIFQNDNTQNNTQIVHTTHGFSNMFITILNNAFYAMTKSVEEIEEKIEELSPGLIKKVHDGMKYLDVIDCLEYLENLLENVCKYNHMYDRILHPNRHIHYSVFVKPNIVAIYNRIDKVTPNNYKTGLIMKCSDEVNGYKLYDFGDNYNIIKFIQFEHLCKVWKGLKVKEVVEESLTHGVKEEWVEYTSPVPELTKEEFLEEYNSAACSDWNSQDEHGECFGGFWKYPEGSYEKENAFDLSRKKNGECLWDLPFPKRFLLETIEIGCCNRLESVRYSNFLGTWMSRKMEQMNVMY